jgi:hypothetical protein
MEREMIVGEKIDSCAEQKTAGRRHHSIQTSNPVQHI